MAKKLLLTPRDVMEILGIKKGLFHKIMKQNLIPYITLWDLRRIHENISDNRTLLNLSRKGRN